jgi:hypothetical protein
MANRVTPTARDADNYAGAGNRAACNDWRRADADSMSARDTPVPLQMPDSRLQAISRLTTKKDCRFYLREESIYVVRRQLRPAM